MAVEIRYEAQSPEEVGEIMRRELADVVDRFLNENYEDSFKKVADILAEQHRRNFDAARDANGNPWAELSPTTIRRKGHATILIDKRDLVSSLIDNAAGDHIEEFSARGIVWGTADRKASRHMTGTAIMPARPPVGVEEETADQVAELLADDAVSFMLEF